MDTMITHDQNYFRSRFDYDHETGLLLWKPMGLTKKEVEALAAYEEHGTKAKAASALGITIGSLAHHLLYARNHQHLGVSSPLHDGKRLADALVGKPAGCLSDGYIIIVLDTVHYLAHRVIWMMVYGNFPIELDHADLNRSNNRLDNLRVATRSQNNMNHPVRCDSESGIKGIYQRADTGKWAAEIRKDGVKICLGSGYVTKEEAMAARHGAATMWHKEFARDA